MKKAITAVIVAIVLAGGGFFTYKAMAGTDNPACCGDPTRDCCPLKK